MEDVPHGKLLVLEHPVGPIQVRYHEAGEGTNYVILVQTGGNATSAYMSWYRNLQPIAEAGYHVYAPDMVGFGMSQVVGSPAQRTPASAFFERFMDALGISGAHFIGNSMGSNAITRFAIDQPDRVWSLVLSGGEPRIDNLESAAVARELGKTPRVDFVREMLSKPEVSLDDMRRATADFFYDRQYPEIDRVARMRLATNNLPGVQERDRAHAFAQAKGGRQNFQAADLARIRAPVYLLHGRDEPGFYSREQAPVLLEAAMRVCLVVPDCSCTILARCGHWPQIEMADTYNALVLQFLHTVQSRC
jgi:pimeloyl-ACP methyl ester carboxylesterase